jgi:LysM repeat protein
MTERVDLGNRTSPIGGRDHTITRLLMRRSDDISPFDHEHDDQDDLTQEFWGADERQSRWAAGRSQPTRRVRRTDDTGSMRALREGVAAFRPQRVELRDATGQVRRTRAHGTPRPATPSLSDRRASASIGDLAAGHFDDHHVLDREHDLPLTPAAPSAARVGFGSVDPLLARLGALVLVGVLLVPLALALRPSSDDQPGSFRIDAPTDEVGAGAAPVVAPATTAALPGTDPDGQAPAAGDPATTATADPAATDPAATPDADSASESAAQPSSESSSSVGSTSTSTSASAVGDVTESVDPGIAEAATVDAAAERIVPECPQTYTAAPGDSWYGIAAAAGVTPSALMAENRATVDTVIFAGDDICLPSGATVPTAPATTTPPATTEPATTTAPTTTQAPTTTVATTTPSGSPGTNASVDEVKAVIRSIFPESEWDTAFTIADRESRFVPTAYNGWCCYGVFQIYWNVHKSWLDDLGISSSSDLYDPLLNVKAAYALWQRSGNSWHAWSTYDG